MNDDERNEVYYKALKRWGPNLQMLVAIEECSELQKAIIKLMRNGYIAPTWLIRDEQKPNGHLICGVGAEQVKEEIADVENMLAQLKIMFGDTTEGKDKKLERLKKVMESNASKPSIN